jgi:hypothetical protein
VLDWGGSRGEKLLWGVVVVVGAVAMGVVALSRGKSVSAAWLVTTAVCIDFIAYCTRSISQTRFRAIVVRSIWSAGHDPLKNSFVERQNARYAREKSWFKGCC